MPGIIDVKANSMEGLMALRNGETIMIDPKGLNTLLHSLEVFREHLYYNITGSMRGSQMVYIISRKGTKVMNFTDITSAENMAALQQKYGEKTVYLEGNESLIVVAQDQNEEYAKVMDNGLVLITPAHNASQPAECWVTVSWDGSASGMQWSALMSQELLEGLCKVAQATHSEEGFTGFLTGWPEAVRHEEMDF